MLATMISMVMLFADFLPNHSFECFFWYLALRINDTITTAIGQAIATKATNSGIGIYYRKEATRIYPFGD